LTRIRLVPIFIIVVVTLVSLIGGWQAYQHFNLLNPLQSKLTQIPGVESSHIDTNSNRITIQLGPASKLQNGDLQTTYDKIISVTEATLGSSISITLLDHRDWSLSSVYETYTPSIAEGITKGNYTEMISSIEQKAKANHITARVTMNLHDIFVQFTKGNSYFYDVIPNSIHQGGGVAS
jgi:hypothetical protein